MIDWKKITKEESALIEKIAGRFITSYATYTKIKIEKTTLLMDLSACHISNPLDSERLLMADSFNFVHDVSGIMHNIDRETGKLLNWFLPRYSKKE